MKLTTILFDLDGTLLPMDQEKFTKAYFKGLAAKAAPYGYEAEKLIDTIWKGTAAMVRNDGSQSNEKVFWKTFADVYGEKALKDIALFDEFYENEFQNIKEVCGFNPKASAVVKQLKEEGYRIVLATNPIFPQIATRSRIRWAGLSPEDFEIYTTYENSCHCKPNQDFYADILKELQLLPEECMMVGNDVDEDMVAGKLGMNVFLLTDCLINRKDSDISALVNGNFDDLSEYIRKFSGKCRN